MAGVRGGGDICLNGPPARHFQRGDKVIILAEGYFEPREMDDIDPVIVIVEDDQNREIQVIRHRSVKPAGKAGAA
jgi:aspartate 1-decarboxylase